MKVATLTIKGGVDGSLKAGDGSVGGFTIDVEIKLHMVIAHTLQEREKMAYMEEYEKSDLC